MSTVIILTEQTLGAAAMRWKWFLMVVALGLTFLLGGLSSPPHSSLRRAIPNLPVPHIGTTYDSSLMLADSSNGSNDGGPPGI